MPAGYQYVDGIVGDVDQGVLRDRRNLAEEGFVVVIVTVDSATGEIVTGPEIVTRGWIYEAEADDLLEDAQEAVRASLADAAAEGATDFETLRRHARKALGRFIAERTRRRPADHPGRDGGLAEVSVDPGLVELHRRAHRARDRIRVRAMGRAIAIHMARAGAEVWINDLDLERAETRRRRDRGRGRQGARRVVADVCDAESVREMVATRPGRSTSSSTTRAAASAACGGGLAAGPVRRDRSRSEWDPIMRVNLTGCCT